MEFTAAMLLSQFRHVASTFSDNRMGENTRYGMEDIASGCFSIFFTQCPSFLAFQRQMQAASGRNNAESLFSITAIAGEKQIREVLDDVPPEEAFPLFSWCFDQFSKGGGMADFKTEIGYCIALDGTGSFSSDTIHCINCLTKTEKKTGKKTYYHSVLTPVMASPDKEHVFPLIPEFILPQDGVKKQDCENQAAKRWLGVVGKSVSLALKQLPSVTHIATEDTSVKGDVLPDDVTILGDDLYAHTPICRDVLKIGCHFIFVCKPESHKTVYDWVEGVAKEHVEDRFDGKKHLIFTYKYAERVPLTNEGNPLLINFVEVTVRNRKTGEQVYHNAFITSHTLEGETEKETGVLLGMIVASGRTRWKIENENNNTLKTKGYHFEHNYGHGQKHLSSLLVTFILLAFLFHTLLDLTCEAYRILISRFKRQFFFSSIRTLTQLFYVPSWEHLFASMKKGLEVLLPLPSTPFATLPSG